MNRDFLSLLARQFEQDGFSFVLYTAVPGAHLRPLIAVVGPTGAGKSELGLRMAEFLDGEIVNCDSLQVYKGFDLGTAKLPAAQRRGIPHHLLDVVDARELFTAGEYGRRARGVVAEIADRGRTPVIVGGTGFYLRALLDGLSPVPERDEELRRRLLAREARRPGSLHRVLRRLDPFAAARIHANDVPKLTRALEIRVLTGRPATAQQPPEALTGFHVVKLGLIPHRAELYRRLDRRCEAMFHGGLIEEVRNLLASGVPADAKPFESLGYRQALAVLQGRIPAAEALADMQQGTRRYAKRQITWFRHEPKLMVLEGFGGDAKTVDQALLYCGGLN